MTTQREKIAMINMVAYGSTGKIMLSIADHARNAGYDARTFVPVPVGKRYRKPAYINEYHNYYGTYVENSIHFLASYYTGYRDSFGVCLTFRLIQKLKKYSPDVIHLHNLHAAYLNLGMLFNYIKKHNIPVVWTLHDCWAFTGQCPYFDLAKCNKWKTGCHDCLQFRGYPATRVDRTQTMWKLKKKWFTGVQNMTIVTPSQWLADLVKESFLKDYPVKVINNGIDLGVFKPTESDFREKYGLQNKKILLGVAFGWGRRKGLDVFIELAKRLDDRYQIVLVGTDEEVDKNLPDHIVSIHRTHDQQELAELYAMADLFVNPTREEVMGMVNVEALACGTPVVTFNTGGSPECIDETCGEVVPCDDIDMLEAAIKRICENRIFSYDACIQRGRYFGGEKKYEEYVSLYETVVGE